MTKTYMLTVPAQEMGLEQWLKLFKTWNAKKWVLGLEQGSGGYRHWQVRVRLSGAAQMAFTGMFGDVVVVKFFDWMKNTYPKAHIEEANDESWEYERKEGRFLTSEDTPEVIRQRYGKLRDPQRRFINLVNTQNDRQIDVLVDMKGNWGKSWLVGHLYETGQGYYLPPTIKSTSDMVKDVASGYDGEKYIIIDIPRAFKWTEEVYTAIEMLKDGLIYDTRYHAKRRNIRGVKIIVFTNTDPKLSKLSLDRWRITTPKALENALGGCPPPSGLTPSPGTNQGDRGALS